MSTTINEAKELGIDPTLRFGDECTLVALSEIHANRPVCVYNETSQSTYVRIYNDTAEGEIISLYCKDDHYQILKPKSHNISKEEILKSFNVEKQNLNFSM